MQSLVREFSRFEIRALCLLSFLVPPGMLPGADCIPFLRGDSNDDGKVDLSDGVATLQFLFVGVGSLDCQDAADADDSGKLELTDAVYTFQFLFLGGPPPKDPGPFQCGRDLTPDLLVGCWALGHCEAPAVREDFSAFRRFEYEQLPALGYCPEIGKVLSAKIVSAGEGAYDLDLAVLQLGQEGVDDCLSLPHLFADCVISVPQATRRLDAGEVETMVRLFSEVPVHLEPHSYCECVAIDPCVIRRFVWDGRPVSDFECNSSYVEPAIAQALRDFLETLRRAP